MTIQATPNIILETGVIVQPEVSWTTILYNCNCHIFNDVVGQIIKATGYSSSKAGHIASIAHHTGKAVVYAGSKEKCEIVCVVLKEIGLVAQVSR